MGMSGRGGGPRGRDILVEEVGVDGCFGGLCEAALGAVVGVAEVVAVAGWLLFDHIMVSDGFYQRS